MATFLKLDGIKGDSSDPMHAAWIDLQSFSWGVHGHPFSDAVKIHDIVVTKRVDSASAQLWQAAVEGRPFMEAIVEMSDDGKVHLSIKLKSPAIASVQASRGEQEPLESVVIVFENAAASQGSSSSSSAFSSATTAIAKAIGQAIANAAKGP